MGTRWIKAPVRLGGGGWNLGAGVHHHSAGAIAGRDGIGGLAMNESHSVSPSATPVAGASDCFFSDYVG